MRHFAETAFGHIREQIERNRTKAEKGEKFLFMMPSLPLGAAFYLGRLLEDYCVADPDISPPVIRVAADLYREWSASRDPNFQQPFKHMHERHWVDERGNLTSYRNEPAPAGHELVVLLIGTDRVTDSSGLADFHHCDFRTIWEEVLKNSFAPWSRACLEKAGIAYHPDTIDHFDEVLIPLVDRGLADILQVSLLLDGLELNTVQDGQDAELLLLNKLGVFGLPSFTGYRFTGGRSFNQYLDGSVAFFSYDMFLEEKARDRALIIIKKFVEHNPPGQLFDLSERGTFTTDLEFIDAITRYISSAEEAARRCLLTCDFVVIRDRILNFRPPRLAGPKKVTIRRLAGSPIEVVLTALWKTLAEFKKFSSNQGMFAHEALQGITIEGQQFKHDCDGESPDERKRHAIAYLSRLLGGVDEWLQDWLGTAKLRSDGRDLEVHSRLVRADLDCKSARTGEPLFHFSVSLKGDGFDEDVIGQFAWRLPEVEPYRVADELIQWAREGIDAVDGYCLPVFHVPYYEELLLAKDHEEIHRVLLQCIQDSDENVLNLLTISDIDLHDPLYPQVRNLAISYGRFIESARKNGLHGALKKDWDALRRAYETAFDAYLSQPSCAESSMATLLFRAFFILRQRSEAEGDRWAWAAFEPSAVVTVLHPALLEMFQAHVVYLLTAFTALARKALRGPGPQAFREGVWQSYVDLSTIQTPICGLIRDLNKILDTSVRGDTLVHRVGSIGNTDASLTTRLLLRYDAFDDEEVTDAELFKTTRESMLLYRILRDYRKLHPHAEDGLSLAIYQNQDIQPLIAAVDQFLAEVISEREDGGTKYQMSVAVFTESSDDTSVSRWIGQWKERWESAESDGALAHYRASRLAVAHRIVSPIENFRQFTQLIRDGLQIDIAVLNSFIGAGTDGNDFERVAPYDVTTRTLKFPVLEKAFCSIRAPGRNLQRARILSNRQFRLSSRHTEIMARLKNPGTPQGTWHVVLGLGDYTPWQGVVDALHQRAEWVVCIDPNIDERLIAEKARETTEAREIIGFGSGVGSHGEANYTISTEQFRMSDVLQRLTSAVNEIYSGWEAGAYRNVAQSVLLEARKLSGLSLVRATGVGQYIRDFMAYSLTRKILHTTKTVLCDQLVSLDAYRHWFDSAETDTRPDLLWLVAEIGNDGRMHVDLRLIECKMAKYTEAHLDKAQQQLENGLRHLIEVFKPRQGAQDSEDDRPDQRYWWLQLHRLIASKAQISPRDQGRVLAALERLVEGDYSIEWRAAAVTYWTDRTTAELKMEEEWQYSTCGRELGIAIVSAGSECVRAICATPDCFNLPWSASYIGFDSIIRTVQPEAPTDGGGEGEGDRARVVDPEGIEKAVREKGLVSERGVETKQVETAVVGVREVPRRILLGKSLQGARTIYWEFGHSELNNRHMLIFGASGEGKTYAIQCLLCELGAGGQNSLIVDYTNGFLPNQLEPQTRKALKPIQHVIRQAPLPVNPFRGQIADLGGIIIPESHSSTAKRIAAIFQLVYDLGEQQFSVLFDAILEGLTEHGEKMSLDYLGEILSDYALDDSKNKNAAQTVSSKIKPFVLDKPFDPGLKGLDWQALFNDVSNRCHVFQLAGLDMHSWRLVTEFILWDLYGYLQAKGRKDDPKVIVLDEIQNLDHRDGSPLSKYLREGRKYGLSLIMATQIMSSLEKDERDRMFNAGHKLFFRPADTEVRAYADIAAISSGEKPDIWVKRLAGLKKGECYSLGSSLNEATGKLEAKAFHIRITSLEHRSTHA